MEAILNGYSEGIALSVDGYLAEGSGENLFIIRDGVMYTAPTTLSILNPHQTVDDLASAAGTIGYEILTALGARYNRIYKGA